MSSENNCIFPRNAINNGKAHIEGKIYEIYNISYGGFAIEDDMQTHNYDKIYNIKIILDGCNFQLEMQCKSIKMWNNQNMCGFEFYKRSKQQIIDVDRYLIILDNKRKFK